MSLLKTVSEKLSAWRRYRETISELAKDFSPHPIEDIASLIADAWRASGNGCRRKPVQS